MLSPAPMPLSYRQTTGELSGLDGWANSPLSRAATSMLAAPWDREGCGRGSGITLGWRPGRIGILIISAGQLRSDTSGIPTTPFVGNMPGLIFSRICGAHRFLCPALVHPTARV